MKNKLVRALAAAVFLTMPFTAFGVVLAPGSQENYLGTGVKEIGQGYTGISELGSIEGNTFNPASLADIRRMANSLVIGGFGTESVLFETGFAYPSDWGVFSLNALYGGSSVSNGMKSLLGAQIQAAKPITENLFWGIGLKFYSASSSSNSDFQFALDTGAVWKPETNGNGFGYLDPSYGIVLKNIGKQINLSDSDPYPGLGLGIGASFLPVKYDIYKMKLSGDLSLPLYPFNASVNVGMENIFFDMFKIRAGYILSTDTFGLAGVGPFTLGLGFTGKIQLKDSTDIDVNYALKNQSYNGKAELAHYIGASVAWGYYDDTHPEVKINPETNYFSPNHDGSLDTVQLNLKIGDNKMVDSWQLQILDANKNPIKTFKSIEKLQVKNLNLAKFFSQVISKKQQVDIPNNIIWNGEDETGKTVSDGVYSAVLKAWDENKNESDAEQGNIKVDTLLRKIQAAPSYTAFAPNGDTKKDITLKLSPENFNPSDTITVLVLDDSGNAVRTFSYTGNAPSSVTWDGRDSQSNIVKQGNYKFKATIESLSGVKSDIEIGNIKMMNTYPKLDINQNATVFSPGLNSFAVFKQTVSDPDGIEQWSLKIYDSTGNVVREFKGTKDLPAEIVWDGKDNAGKKIPDQIYNYDLSLVYDSGYTPRTERKTIEIDSTPATAAVKLEYLSFSPIEGSKQKTISFTNTITGKDDDQIELQIMDPVGNVVYYDKETKNNFPAVFTWNGLDKDLKPLPEGRYSYLINTQDKAGNKSTTRVDNITLRTGREKVTAQSDVLAFSPGSSIQGKANFALDGSRDAVAEFAFEIKLGEQTVKSFISNQFIDKVSWDGKDNSGITVPDGNYIYTVRVKYNNGQEPVSSPRQVKVDTKAPVIDVSIDDPYLSPNNDGRKETLSVNQKITGETSDVYNAAFIDAAGKPVKTYYWAGSVPTPLIWDGKDDKGTPAAEGSYTYSISGTDLAKNQTVKAVSNIVLTRAVETLAFDSDVKGFSPTGTAGPKALTFTSVLTPANTPANSALVISDPSGKTVKSWIKENGLDNRIVWDGKDNSGINLPDGFYSAEMVCDFLSGNQAMKQITNLVLDRSAPNAKLSVSPDLFTPDGDGEQDKLYINFELNDISAISNWQIGIYKKNDDGKEGTLFKSFSGKTGGKQILEWDGTGNDAGDTVDAVQDYILDFTATDVFGNKTTNITRTIPVGVLVEKTPDGLKIRVSSIKFALNKADLVGDSKTNLDKVIYIIRKILSDPRKYGITENYKIEISGHTDDLQGPTPDFNQKLSERRAKSVYDYLVEQDVNAKILTSVGYGETKPFKIITADMTKEKKDDYRARNRRVEFFIRK